LADLERVIKKKTSLIVSHRISSVKNADKIVVIDNGRIIESGTHQSLIDMEKVYYKMYQRQLLELNEQKVE